MIDDDALVLEGMGGLLRELGLPRRDRSVGSRGASAEPRWHVRRT